MTNPSTSRPVWVLPLYSESGELPAAALENAGGKGTNLARLARAGFQVPDGFIVTTAAYRCFAGENCLDVSIREKLLQAGSQPGPEQLEDLSAAIRQAFTDGRMPPEIEQSVRKAYRRLGGGAPVAVRSSATAEDLPDLSFAGQQDTFLNVQGEEALLKAVVDCWSSLWTARAIGYRARNSVEHMDAALAVVVQAMVDSQASGVMFTANPLSGLRSQTVIDATLGLGEALVSGMVEPDHYVIDTRHNQVVHKQLGAKARSVRGRAGGGTDVVHEDAAQTQALPDDQIMALAKLGQAVAAEYAFPQDIEWAYAGGQLYLLQSRPVTSLFPMPEGLPPETLRVTFSFGAVQGMQDPMTPLGQDCMRLFFAVGASLYGIRFTPETQTVLLTAGERLWVNITTLLRNRVGRKVVMFALKWVEPTARQALEEVIDDPRLQPGKQTISFRAARQIARAAIPGALNMLLNLVAPDTRRRWIVGQGEEILTEVERQLAALQGDRYTRLAEVAALLPEFGFKRLPPMLIRLVTLVAAGMASFNFLNMLAGSVPGSPEEKGLMRRRVLEITRGLANNPTTEMDLALWAAASKIRQDPAARQEFEQLEPAELAARFQSGSIHPATREIVSRFLGRYGGRGLAEIDLGRARWAEDPAHVFEVLSGYLKIEPGDQAPDSIFARGANAAQQEIDGLAAEVRNAKGGWIKARLVRFFAGRMRALMGARESPKFLVVRLLWQVRHELLRLGEEFVQAGELEQGDDLVFLRFAELAAFARREEQDWKGMIAARRSSYGREFGRRQIPRVLISDGRVFYEGMRSDGETGAHSLTGSPVSPGSVEGRVRVVLDPRQANLIPGEIMVCPGTDPSWTPLFLTAAGLVMEVGGMMTHGAVVAREYGIPAVVGVHQATMRLQTGQRIRLDGSSGLITLLDDGASAGQAES